MSRGWRQRKKRTRRIYANLRPKWFIDLGPGTDPNEGDMIGEAYHARVLWPDVQVFGIEPCSEYIDLQTGYGYPGRILNLAAWHTDGEELPFYVDADVGPEQSYWMSLIAPDPKVFDRPLEKKTRTVRTVTLDLLDTNYGPFDDVVIWADIQGAELPMLQGASQLLRSGRVLALNLEVFPEPYKDWASEAEINEYLKGFNYHPVAGSEPRHAFYDMLYVKG